MSSWFYTSLVSLVTFLFSFVFSLFRFSPSFFFLPSFIYLFHRFSPAFHSSSYFFCFLDMFLDYFLLSHVFIIFLLLSFLFVFLLLFSVRGLSLVLLSIFSCLFHFYFLLSRFNIFLLYCFSAPYSMWLQKTAWFSPF